MVGFDRDRSLRVGFQAADLDREVLLERLALLFLLELLFLLALVLRLEGRLPLKERPLDGLDPRKDPRAPPLRERLAEGRRRSSESASTRS